MVSGIRLQTLFALLASLLAALSTMGVPPHPHGDLGLTWYKEVVDNGTAGWYSSIGLSEGSETPLIAHADFPRKELRIAERNGGVWRHTLVDAGGLFYPNLVVAAGRTTIVYANLSAQRDLRFAERLNDTWSVEVVYPHPASAATAITLDEEGRRVVAFQGYPTGDPSVPSGLLFAQEVEPGWRISVVDAKETTAGGISIARFGSTYAIAWARGSYPAENRTARLAIGNNSSWRIENITTGVFVGPSSIGVAFDAAGAIHLAFGRGKELIHRFWEGGRSIDEVVDRATRQGDIGLELAFAIGSDGKARLSYLVSDTYRLMFAVRESSAWNYSEVERGTNRGFMVSMALDSSLHPHLAYQDFGYPVETDDLWYATTRPLANRPPVAEGGGPYAGVEGTRITFDAGGSSDPDGDPLQFRWDFEADGVWDTPFSSDPLARHTWGDDFGGAAVLEVTDGANRATASVPVSIANVAPALGPPGVSIVGEATLVLRVAGEKYHDVTATLYRDGNPIGGATVLRRPGSPEEQSAVLGTVRAADGAYLVRVVYTPLDDPVNGEVWGATPAWLVLEQGGTKASFHHTFNARHPETWTWEVGDLESHVLPGGVRFSIGVTDAGSDDLTVSWDFGDGTSERRVYLNDPAVGPDPFPSPDVNPRAVTANEDHVYAAPGKYTVTVTVVDDDGGAAVATFEILV